MTSEIHSDEQQILSLVQNLLNVLAGVDQEKGERATKTAFMAKGWIPRDFLMRNEASIPPDGTLGGSQSATAFFNRGEKLKPAENAFLCAVYHYSQHGCQAFSVGVLREIARDAGLVLPDRVDMTFKAARKDGKRYFQPTGKGIFKLTTHGELYIQGRWEVKPGKLSKALKGKQ